MWDGHARSSGRLGAAVAVALVLLATSVKPLVAQSKETAAIRVRVTDAATGRPIEGAQVGFPELRIFRLTNAPGIAQIAGIPPGSLRLEVSMLGYGKATKSLRLDAHAVATGEIALTADPIEIDGLTVTTTGQIERLRRVGYYNRERMGIGHFVGPLEIASEIAVRPSDLFAGIPGVERVSIGSGGRYQIMSARPCGTPSRRSNAGITSGASAGIEGLTILLDGARYFDEIDRLPIGAIQAMEVYVGSEIPAQYDGPDVHGCGVILLWTQW